MTTPASELTPKQQEVNRLLAGPQRHTLIYGGSRSGKTFLLVRAVVTRALKAPNTRHLIARFRGNAVRASIALDTLPTVVRTCWPGVWENIKEHRQDGFFELHNGSQIWLGGLDDKDRVEKILGQEYCVHPESKILMADLTWRRAQDVSKGDEIISFPESLDGHMKLVRGTIQFNKPLHKRRYRVVTNKGETIVSEGHRFVAYRDDRRARNFRPLSWQYVEDLSPGDKIRFAATPWTTDKSHDGGWMAGILDGEGWLKETVAVAQNPGPVLERIKQVMGSRGVDYREHDNGGCHSVTPKSLWDAMRLLGSTRPTRLLPKSSELWENRRGFVANGDAMGSASEHHMRSDARHVAEILSIEEINEGEVRSITTSTATFISDGFLSHNCTVYLNECSQIPYSSALVALTRLAQTTPEIRQRAYYDLNPSSTGHWSYRLFVEGKEPRSLERIESPEQYQYATINPRDNEANLSEDYLRELRNMPERQRKRFYDGAYVSDVEGQLWPLHRIEASRVSEEDVPELRRIVVAVDPSGAQGNEDERSDEIGMVVAGISREGHAYVLDDATLRAGPAGWGQAAVKAFHEWSADRVIGEKNYGGAMVEHVIRTADKKVPVKLVTASRGKAVRAEPVAALYEPTEDRGPKVHHVGRFQELEDQLQNFTTHGYVGERSPDRGDALVWALTELMLGESRSVSTHAVRGLM